MADIVDCVLPDGCENKDLIDRQREEIGRLREALQPFAALADEITLMCEKTGAPRRNWAKSCDLEDLDRAKSALGGNFAGSLAVALRELIQTCDVMARSTSGVKPATRQPWLRALQSARSALSDTTRERSEDAPNHPVQEDT